MIKRTIAIDNPAWLKIKESQLIVEQDGKTVGRIPAEDVGILIVDHPAVVYTQGCLNALLENNTAIIVCGQNHHPSGLFLPLDSNSVQSERFRLQVEASAPLKKQLWRNTVREKKGKKTHPRPNNWKCFNGKNRPCGQKKRPADALLPAPFSHFFL